MSEPGCSGDRVLNVLRFGPERMLHVLRLPFRLTAAEVGVLLHLHEDGVNHLAAIGELATLTGDADGQRMFAAAYIESLRADTRKLKRITSVEKQRVKKKNDAQAVNAAKRKR